VFTAAIHSGMVWLAILGLINSGIAAFYYLRLLTAVYSRPSEGALVESVPRAGIPLLFAIFLTASATLILGVVPGRVLTAARAAATSLIAPGSTVVAQLPAPTNDATLQK
jgi:NADH-quinone oxidoreductase subunit N